MPIFAIVLAVIVLFALWLVVLFTALITLRNRTQEAWSDIDVQLRRRYDLIPNLIASVKGYMKHERELLEKVTQYRAKAIDAQKSGNTQELAKAENMLGGMLGQLTVAVEAYPDLKAQQNVAQL